MKALEDKILNEGKIISGSVLKVGSFLNQQIDTAFMFEIGREIHRLFKEDKITKILTVEASGIAPALAAAYYFDIPVVFAKKSTASNLSGDMYSSQVKSFTHNAVFEVCVGREYIGEEDTVLIVDDFLAEGNAAEGLLELCNKANASVAGIAIVIEKIFQGGGDSLRERGVRVESLAMIESMGDGKITFRNQ